VLLPGYLDWARLLCCYQAASTGPGFSAAARLPRLGQAALLLPLALLGQAAAALLGQALWLLPLAATPGWYLWLVPLAASLGCYLRLQPQAATLLLAALKTTLLGKKK